MKNKKETGNWDTEKLIICFSTQRIEISTWEKVSDLVILAAGQTLFALYNPAQ